MASTRATPVLLLGFNRPDTTSRVFERIAQHRPQQLFVALDGPREHVSSDSERCQSVASIVTRVDWDCDVRLLQQSRNLGCKAAIETGINWFFEAVDHGIVLEDDCLPSDSFFSFCEELLDRYRLDSQVMCISGDHFHSCCVEPPQSYYFSKYMHCWGWATWRRAWRLHSASLDGDGAVEDSSIIAHYPTTPAESRYWRKRFNRVRTGRARTWDYGWQRSIWKHRGLVACPRVNLVENIGHGTDATHTTDQQAGDLPSAHKLTITSHPDVVQQNLIMDDHEAKHVYRFGQKTWIDRSRAELVNVWRSIQPTRVFARSSSRAPTQLSPSTKRDVAWKTH